MISTYLLNYSGCMLQKQTISYSVNKQLEYNLQLLYVLQLTHFLYYAGNILVMPIIKLVLDSVINYSLQNILLYHYQQ